jgi:hypothetical protein
MVLAPGCAKQYVAKVATFEPTQQASVIEQAPHTGNYSLQFTAQRKYLKTPLYASDRWVQRGDALGFKKNDDGSIVAVCGLEQIPIESMPPKATHVMWYHKSKVPTQFGKEVNKALRATGEVATVAGTCVAIAGLAALALWASSECHDHDTEVCLYRSK